MIRFLLLPLCALLLFGCEQESVQPSSTTKDQTVELQPLPKVSQKPVTLLKDPLNAVLVETAAEAIPTWRKFAKAKPTLVLLSQNPFLTPVPDLVKDEALQLVHNGNLEDFKKKATTYVPSPVILPQMALSAALDAGFFSKLVWVLPTGDDTTELSLEIFIRQLVESGSASQEEADSFVSNGKGFSGMLRQTAVSAIPYHALSRLEDPVIVHLDLSFLKALYKNEIKTPIHPLTYDVLSKLRTADLRIFATTVSYSHQESNISLEVRFLGNLVKRFLADPGQLDKPRSDYDSQFQLALYLGNFFKKEEVRDIYLALEKTTPQDADIKYALYQVSRQFKQGDKALEYLAQSAALDSAYALEYLDLALMAAGKGRPEEAIRMLTLASEQFPENPFIQLYLANLLASKGDRHTANTHLESLLKLPWSDLYFKGMKDSLRARIKASRKTQKE